MKKNSAESVHLPPLKPVSTTTLAAFDAVFPRVEEEVCQQSLSTDNPELTMGPEASTMVKNGLGFVSKMLRAMMAYGAENIINDELEWGKTRLPVYGVSMTMVLTNLERYTTVLEKILIADAYMEVQPYLSRMIELQSRITKDANGTE